MVGNAGVGAQLNTLNSLVSRIWGPQASVFSGVGALDLPLAQQFLALPSPRNPRLLIPLASGRVARGAALANLPLKRQKDTALRRLLAGATRLGLRGPLTRQLWVGVDDRLGDNSLVRCLESALGQQISGLSVAAREITPNYKPTLLLIGERGQPLGYVKVGWNPGTIERLLRERKALDECARHPPPNLRAPACLAELEWEGRLLLVVAPVPSSTTPARLGDPAPLDLVALARSRPLTRAFDEIVTGQLARATDDLTSLDPEFSAAIEGYADVLSRRWSGFDVPVGLTHGDLVPWNVGHDRETVWAWDWEHSEKRGVPMLDVVHWYAQILHIRERLPVDLALERAAVFARQRLASDGLSSTEETDVALGLSFLAAASRACQLHQASGLWRAGVRSGLISLLNGPGNLGAGR